MKRIVMILLLSMIVILPGCEKTKAEDNPIQCVSEVAKEECCICGVNNRSLMDYYRKSGMIGLVCLNTMNISNLDTRQYSNDGAEIIDDNSGDMYNSHGENECSFSISGMPSRGILEATVYYGEDAGPDFDVIKDFLCQECINKVIEMYNDEMSWSNGDGRFPEVCLVDFATNELYTLGEHHTGYWIRDFWVHIDHKKEQSDVMLIYAPEDKMEGYKYAGENIEAMQN